MVLDETTLAQNCNATGCDSADSVIGVIGFDVDVEWGGDAGAMTGICSGGSVEDTSDEECSAAKSNGREKVG